MNNQIVVTLGGKDALTPQLKGWVQGWQALAKETDSAFKLNIGGGAAQGTANSFSSALGASFWGNLWAGAVMSGVGAFADLAAKAGGFLKDSLMEGASMQTKTIGVGSDVGTNLGINIKEGRALVERVQGELARVAADLPGLTKDYTEIFNQVAIGVSSVIKDPEQFKYVSTDIAKRAGVLAVKSGADAGMGGNALNRAITGTTGLSEVFQVDIFQKNAQFQSAIRESLKGMGKSAEDWKKLTTENRLGIIQKALRSATPDSLLNEFKGTTESILQGWQTNMFDPIIGTFGVLRKVGERGGRTALDAFATFLQGVDGLAKGLMTALGMDGVDPMAMVIDAFDMLARGAKALKGMLALGDMGGLGAIGDSVVTWFRSANIGGNVGKMVTDGLNWLSDAIAATDWVGLGGMIGQAAHQGIVELRRLASNGEMWLSIARFLGSMVNAAFLLLAGSVQKQVEGTITDWGKAWNALTSGFTDFLNKITQAIQGLMNSLPGAGVGALNPVAGVAASAVEALPLPEPAKNAIANIKQAVTINGTNLANPTEVGAQVANSIGKMYNDFQNSRVK